MYKYREMQLLLLLIHWTAGTEKLIEVGRVRQEEDIQYIKETLKEIRE